MNPFTLKWMINQDDAGKLLKEFFKEQEVSRAALADIKFCGGDIVVNGTPVTVRYRLQFDDEVTLVFPLEEASAGIIAEHIPLKIVYEDDYVLIVDKPPFMPTIPSRDHPSGTLANGVLAYYKMQGLKTTVHIVTRLDRDTSGLVLIAKHRHVHHLLAKQQLSHQIKRRYEALVHGILECNNGIIDAPIGRKDGSIIEREVRDDGKEAVTYFEVINRFDAFTHVSLQLGSGRTHQIRVHMSYSGHPLIGDDLYGGSTSSLNRQALHSCELKFWHPFLKENVIFLSPLPIDIEKLVALKRKG